MVFKRFAVNEKIVHTMGFVHTWRAACHRNHKMSIRRIFPQQTNYRVFPDSAWAGNDNQQGIPFWGTKDE